MTRPEVCPMHFRSAEVRRSLAAPLLEPRVASPRPSRWISIPLWVLLLLFLAQPSFLLAATVRASLDRDTIPVGENAVITLVIEGANPKSHPRFASMPGLKILPGGQSTQVTIINGERRMQLTLSYSVEASKIGDFIIPPAEVQTDVGVLKTPSLRLSVTKASATPVGDGPASLRIAPKKERVVVGEIIPVDIQLYVTEGKLLQMPQLTADGFTLGKLNEPTQSRVRVNGRELNLVTFRTTATAVKAGALVIGPITMPLEVPVAGNRLDNFFFRPSQQIKLTAEPVTIQSEALPPGAPDGFQGAIGLFSMDCNASPTQLTAGDPITLKVQISGTGNIENLGFASLDSWQGFKVYPPNGRLMSDDPLLLSGTKVFEQVVVPQSHDIKELPAIKWSYFDPDQRAYRTLECKSVPLQLAPANTGANLANLPATAFTPGGTRLAQGGDTNGFRHIRPQLGTIISPAHQPGLPGWFWAFQGAPVVAWLCLRARRWLAESLARNPSLLRRKQLEKEIDRGLYDLRKLAASNDRAPFFDTLSGVLRRAIAARLDVPESGLTESVIDERLRPSGMSEDQIRALEELFQASNQARYSAGSQSASLPNLLQKLESSVKQLLSPR